MGARDLTEEGGGLLPFAFGINVTVVPASKTKHIQKVALWLIVFYERLPCNTRGGGEISERRRPELRMLPEKRDDLHCIDVADHSQASAPRIPVAVRRKQVPPGAHLRFQSGFEGLHQVFAVEVFIRLIYIAGVLIRVTVVAASRNIVVGVQS